jgi:hypothetical protein
MEDQKLRDHALKVDDEYRHLFQKHRGCEDKLERLEHHFYLSDAEKLEKTNLKKQKLQLKDRMQEILNKYKGELAGQRV